jgi:hypothetical protein
MKKHPMDGAGRIRCLTDPWGVYFEGMSDQYFLESWRSASSREISPELHFAMICTSLSLSL